MISFDFPVSFSIDISAVMCHQPAWAQPADNKTNLRITMIQLHPGISPILQDLGYRTNHKATHMTMERSGNDKY